MSFGLGFVFVGVRVGGAHSATAPAALTGGFHRALIACVIYIAAAALIALRATNTRGEKQPAIEAEPALHAAETAPGIKTVESEIVVEA